MDKQCKKIPKKSSRNRNYEKRRKTHTTANAKISQAKQKRQRERDANKKQFIRQKASARAHQREDRKRNQRELHEEHYAIVRGKHNEEIVFRTLRFLADCGTIPCHRKDIHHIPMGSGPDHYEQSDVEIHTDRGRIIIQVKSSEAS